MLSTDQLSDMFELVVVLVGVGLLLKKVAEIDGYHNVRFVVMTVILCVVSFWVIDRVGREAVYCGTSDCVVVFDDYIGPA
jgi:hypothetical protein